MHIDSHQHYWSIARGDYGWLTPALSAIYRDFGPDHLAPILARHDIAKTILVQAAPTVAETEFLLAVADTTPSVAGVVGWIDFTADDAQEVIARLAAHRKLVGLRPMVHDIADVNWLRRIELAPAIEAMVAHDLVFDALVRPPHLPALKTFIERFPRLRVVIDHGAKPEIARRREQPWLDNLRAIATHERVACKVSGLVTEAAPDWRPDDILPYIARLIELFGADRLMWGSDWPVVTLAASYDVWWTLTAEALQDLDPAQRANVLGGNAARVYLGHGRGAE